jgi:multidrug efflux pump subunit AcrA (membrane-fusion protein)
MKFSNRSKLSMLVLILAAVLIAYAKSKSSKPDMQAGNQSVTATRQTLIQRVTIAGGIWPRKRLDVKPPFNGYIAKLFVKIGDHVKSRDPVVTFSPSLSGAENNFPMRVGFDGIVTQVLKQEGEYVTETGDTNLVVRIEDLSELSVLATVPELDVAKIKIGQEAQVKLSAILGESFKGEIREIALSAKDKPQWSGGSTSSEFQIKVLLKTHDPRLVPGMSAMMDVITQKKENVLALGHEFVEEDKDGYFATLMTGEKRRLKVGMQTDEAVEIISGLNEGEKVRAIDFLNQPKMDD